MSLTKDILTPQEVAEYLQITSDTVYRYIREGKLVASKLGRQYRIPKENIELLLLVTSTAGGAQLRTFSREDIAAWFREDEIAEGTRAVGEKLLTDLRNERQ
jgi:excisionase family DNA binding protein